MRRLCLWSDGCGGQFKNKWQMAKLVDLLGDTRFNLVGTEHHFFASCHGEGPCDGLGGWTKTYLRDEEMKKGNHVPGRFRLFGERQAVRQQRRVGGGDERAAEGKVADIRICGFGGRGQGRGEEYGVHKVQSLLCDGRRVHLYVPYLLHVPALQGDGVGEVRAGGVGGPGEGEADGAEGIHSG